MRYTTRAKDLPKSEIPKGYEACKPNYAPRGELPWYAVGNHRYKLPVKLSISESKRSKPVLKKQFVSTFGDILLDLEKYFGDMIKENRSFIREVDDRIFGSQFVYNGTEDFFSDEYPPGIGGHSDNFHDTPLWRQAQKEGDLDRIHSLYEAYKNLDYLELYELRLKVIETLRAVDLPENIEKLEIPEDVLIRDCDRSMLQNAIHGFDPERYGYLYLPRERARRICLPSYNRFTEMINKFKEWALPQK